MSDVKWHEIGLQCPQCHGTFTVIAICASADGKILVEGICVKCGINLAWQKEMAELISSSTKLDLAEKWMEKKTESLPALPKPFFSPAFNADDKQLLRDFHISPEET